MTLFASVLVWFALGLSALQAATHAIAVNADGSLTLSRVEMILPEHLPTRVRTILAESSTAAPVDAHRLEEIELQAILQALRKHGFNRTESAKVLGISRRTLVYKLQRLRELGHAVDAE